MEKLQHTLLNPAYKRSLQTGSKQNYFLSIVVPVYNEEKIINGTLKEILEFLKHKHYSWEVLVVDDGSKDKTSEIVKKFRRIRLLTLPENKGKGAALREGIMESRGKYVVFTDADLSVPLDNTDKLLEKLKKGIDVAIGSRRVVGANIEVHQPILRESMGRVYTLLTRVVTGVSLSDFTCGFKGFSGNAAKEIFKRSKVDRWSYDAEIMFLARKLGYKIAEVPVAWRNRFESRVRLGSAVFSSFRDLLKVRIDYLLGKYEF